MVWAPRDRLLVMKVAAPPLKVPVPSVVVPSLKVTVPLAALGVTVEVKVTLDPIVEGLRLEESVLTVEPVRVCTPPADVGPPVTTPDAKVKLALPIAFTESVFPAVAPEATSAVMKK